MSEQSGPRRSHPALAAAGQAYVDVHATIPVSVLADFYARVSEWMDGLEGWKSRPSFRPQEGDAHVEAVVTVPSGMVTDFYAAVAEWWRGD